MNDNTKAVEERRRFQIIRDIVNNALKESDCLPKLAKDDVAFLTKDITKALYEANLRPESEVRAEAVKEFTEKATGLAIKMFPVSRYTTNSCGDVSDNNRQKRKEFIQLIKMATAAEYGEEVKDENAD